MEGHMHHRHHHPHHHHPLQQQQQQQQMLVSSVDAGDRFPQWSLQETKEFLMIRAELDRSFMETKRNKLLWEVISTKMKEKGFNRSAEQCKCKWKNLVTRYKGCETMEPEAAMRQQFPFYNEMQAIFTARMERMLWAEEADAAAASGSSKKKQAATQLSSDDEDDEDTDDAGELTKITAVSRKKKKAKTSGGSTSAGAAGGGGGGGDVNSLKGMLEEFMKQQVQMDLQWREAWEAREEERRRREVEWRQTMEALEKERLMMERRWWEREEQRRIREEARAERRDVLINALMEKLRREQDI